VLVVEGKITVSKGWYRQDRRCGRFWVRLVLWKAHESGRSRQSLEHSRRDGRLADRLDYHSRHARLREGLACCKPAGDTVCEVTVREEVVVPLRGRKREAVQQERRCSEWTARPRHPVHPTPYHPARRLALFTRHRAASILCNRDAATHRPIVNFCSGIARANGDRLDSVTGAVLAYTTDIVSASSDSHVRSPRRDTGSRHAS
jgi:hypothetical protein